MKECYAGLAVSREIGDVRRYRIGKAYYASLNIMHETCGRHGLGNGGDHEERIVADRLGDAGELRQSGVALKHGSAVMSHQQRTSLDDSIRHPFINYQARRVGNLIHSILTPVPCIYSKQMTHNTTFSRIQKLHAHKITSP